MSIRFFFLFLFVSPLSFFHFFSCDFFLFFLFSLFLYTATAFFFNPAPPLPPFDAMSQLYTLEMLTCVVVMQSLTKSKSSPLVRMLVLAAASFASSRAWASGSLYSTETPAPNHKATPPSRSLRLSSVARE